MQPSLFCRGNYIGAEGYPFEPGKPCNKCLNNCNEGLCSKSVLALTTMNVYQNNA